jgi:hypothetical protein
MDERKRREMELADKFMTTIGERTNDQIKQPDQAVLYSDEMKFLTIKNKPLNKTFLPISLDIKSFMKILETDTDRITIEVSDFDIKTDHILVFLGGLYLDYNVCYKIEGNQIINLHDNIPSMKWRARYVINCVVMQNCVVRDLTEQDIFGWE